MREYNLVYPSEMILLHMDECPRQDTWQIAYSAMQAWPRVPSQGPSDGKADARDQCLWASSVPNSARLQTSWHKAPVRAAGCPLTRATMDLPSPLGLLWTCPCAAASRGCDPATTVETATPLFFFQGLDPTLPFPLPSCARRVSKEGRVETHVRRIGRHIVQEGVREGAVSVL